MKKTLLAIIIAIIALGAKAQDYTYLGTGYNFHEKISDGNFTFDCYTWSSADVEYKYATLVKCNISTNTVSAWQYTIPSTVTSNGVNYKVWRIADKAFFTHHEAASVTIPSTVTGIGREAFYNCSALHSVEMADGVRTIGESAFSYCTSLSYLTTSFNLQKIENYAFAFCTRLQSITLPSTLTTLGNNVFQNCSGLNSILWVMDPAKISSQYLSEKYLFRNVPRTVLVYTETKSQAAIARKYFDLVYCAEEANRRNSDVNDDGYVNGADVVSVYNDILNGQK